jgi:hypothetical protein
MKKLVNYQKRSIQLPKGCKNLSDLLDKPKHPQEVRVGSFEKVRRSKCDYCGSPAVAGSFSYQVGDLPEEAHFWCQQCQRDLAEFGSRPENSIPDDIDVEDGAKMEKFGRLLQGIEIRKDEFMRQKVAARQNDNAA